MTYVADAGALLASLCFGAIALLFALRLLAEASRADFANPLSQAIYRATNPVLAPIRRVVPNWRRINLAAVLVLCFAMLLKRIVLFVLASVTPNLVGCLILAIADAIDEVAWLYIVLIVVWSLLSSFGADPRQPALRLSNTIVDPLLRPLRGTLVFGTIDFSPTVAVILLLLARILLVGPLSDFAMRLALT